MAAPSLSIRCGFLVRNNTRSADHQVEPKVIIVRGRCDAVRTWMHQSASDDEECIELDTTASDFPVPWRAARSLFRELAHQRGFRATADAVAPYRQYLSTILRPLQSELTVRESINRIDESGAMLGRTPSATPPRVAILGDAFGSALATLLGDTPLRLLIANAAAFDSESWGILCSLLQQHPALTLVIGTDPDYEPSSVLQARVAVVGAWELSVLAAIRHVKVERLELDDDIDDSPPPRDPARSPEFPLDDDLELRANDLLASGADLTESARQTVIAAIHAAFDAMGYPAVISLAQRLLAASTGFEGEEEVGFLAGLAAQNLCSFAAHAPNDHPLSLFAVEQLDRALPRLRKPEDRIMVMYLRGMQETRRKEGLSAAKMLLSRALQEASSLPAESHPLHRAYAHNGLAYVMFRLGERDAAHDLCRAALTIVEGPRGDAPEIEMASAHFNILVNLGRLAFMDGDAVTARERLVAAQERLDTIPARRPFFSWFSTQVFIDDMAAAADRLEGILAELDPQWGPPLIAAYSYWAADLHFRLGNSQRALERFRTAAQLWSNFHENPGDILSSYVNCAVAAFHDGQLEEARSWFLAVHRAIPPEDVAQRVEVEGALALIAARAGDEARALSAIAAVMDTLESVDETDVRARVWRVIGDAYLALENRDAAYHAFVSGLDSAGTLPPEDMLGLLLGLLELDAGTPAVLRQAVEIAPSALNDSTAWWDAKRLVRTLSEPQWRRTLRTSSTSVKRFLSLARQRADCAPLVDAVDRSLLLDNDIEQHLVAL